MSGEKHHLGDEGLGGRPGKSYADRVPEENGMEQTVRQTAGRARCIACTALLISLRVNLLAETARETRFHARGLRRRRRERRRKEKGGTARWDVNVKKTVPNMYAEEEQVPCRAARHVLVSSVSSMRQSDQKKENPELLTS